MIRVNNNNQLSVAMEITTASTVCVFVCCLFSLHGGVNNHFWPDFLELVYGRVVDFLVNGAMVREKQHCHPWLRGSLTIAPLTKKSTTLPPYTSSKKSGQKWLLIPPCNEEAANKHIHLPCKLLLQKNYFVLL